MPEKPDIDAIQREFEADWRTMYQINRALLRTFKRRNPILLDGLGARLKEPWRRVSHMSRAATWAIDADGDEVTLTCTRQDDGHKHCTLKCRKDGHGRGAAEVLGERLLAHGARLVSDSEKPAQTHRATEHEIRQLAVAYLFLRVTQLAGNADTATPLKIDRSTLEAVRSQSKLGKSPMIGWSDASNARGDELAESLSYDELFDQWCETASHARGNSRLHVAFGGDRSGLYVSFTRLEVGTRTGEHFNFRPWFDRTFRGLGTRLATMAMRKHKPLAWTIYQLLFGFSGIDKQTVQFGLWLRGWRRTPHSRRVAREQKMKLKAMKREWSK